MEYKNITMPDGLKELAYDFMRDIIDRLDEEQKLHRLDAMTLYMMAGNINSYLECEENIAIQGITIESDRGNSSLSPYVLLQKQVQGQITVLLKEMGLTLGSRTRLKLPAPEEESRLTMLMKN